MRAVLTGLLGLCLLTIGSLGQVLGEPLKLVSYEELGRMVRALKGKVVVVYFWADY